MRWKRLRKSENIEDRRGHRGSSRMPRRGGGGMKIGGGAGIVLVILGLVFGQDIIGQLATSPTTPGAPPQLGQQTGTNSDGSIALRDDDEAGQFISSILATTEDVWGGLFEHYGQRYQAPNLVMFSDAVTSACGHTTSAAGPFYCPGDSKVYIDLSFFRELQRMGAGGDFAQAYVLAHEVGHHVQNQLGVSMEVQRRQRSLPKKQANRLSVLTELQADCYAGVWAHHAHKRFQLLEPGDLEEGMNAASKIGDDALMRSAGRRAHPDAFTHGTSQQRQKWLYIGLETGDPQQCNTLEGVS